MRSPSWYPPFFGSAASFLYRAAAPAPGNQQMVELKGVVGIRRVDLNMKRMPTRFVPSPDALARELNGEILVLDLKSSHYFGLTGTAARIWQLIEAGHGPDSAAEALALEFDADQGLIRNEVTEFVTELVDRGLLVADNA